VTEAPLYAGIELGGTKILARIVNGAGIIVGEGRFATSTPAHAIEDLTGCIGRAVAGRRLTALGVASFGPIVIDPDSARYGRLLATSKPGWSDFDLRAGLLGHFPVPMAIETDVNAAALAEQESGAGRGLRSVAYVTVGTGIGGALAIDGTALRGALHPEIGHLRLRRRPQDQVQSTCRFHEDCAEGLASGPAVKRRLGEGRLLQEAPEVFALVAAYLGELAASLLLAWSPERIVLGGGVMSVPGLIEAVAASMHATLGDYGAAIIARDGYVVRAMLTDPGLEGALMLARAVAGREPR
jgi:fructokinase